MGSLVSCIVYIIIYSLLMVVLLGIFSEMMGYSRVLIFGFIVIMMEYIEVFY